MSLVNIVYKMKKKLLQVNGSIDVSFSVRKIMGNEFKKTWISEFLEIKSFQRVYNKYYDNIVNIMC